MKPGKKRPEVKYPIYSFRASKDDKERITKKLKSLVKQLNSERPEGSYAWRMNDVLLKALEIGFEELSKR